jgi:large subunit ribosomal protein L4e
MATAAARPVVQVWNVADNTATPGSQVALPAVFVAPIRDDVVQFVHTNIRKNARQAYAVDTKAGGQTSAESWGTGRAVSRIPRVPGGGTHRSGQGAFGNMCRGGRRFGATRVWRKWHRKVNRNQRRYAVTSALAASAVPALVMARGHRVENLEEVPMVVSSESVKNITKTREAIALLQAIGAYDDVERAMNSKKVRAGKGKMRNRRYTMRRGPLVVFKDDTKLARALRNVPGVDTQRVNRLNLLELAPGGHVGRFIVWVEDAFEHLNALYGDYNTKGQKSGFSLPRSLVANSDINRTINSQEIQSQLRAPQRKPLFVAPKKNPLKNLGAMIKLNPYALTAKRNAILDNEYNRKRKLGEATVSANRKAAADAKKKAKTNAKRRRTAFYDQLHAPQRTETE